MMRVVFQDSTLSIQEEETERESDGERERGVGGRILTLPQIQAFSALVE